MTSAAPNQGPNERQSRETCLRRMRRIRRQAFLCVFHGFIYFFPRKLVISNKVTKEQLETNTFMASQISYEGEERNLIGAAAVSQYLQDNKNRTPGIKRKIYTGEKREYILYTTVSGKVVRETQRQIS